MTRAPWTLLLLVVCSLTATAVAQQPEDPPEELRLEAYRQEKVETPPAPPAPPPLAGGSDYRIGRQDLLEVSVFDLEELNQTVRVADDGSISMPLLGRLDVAGLSKTGLERLIARLLEERFVRDPQVTVFIKEYESKKVAVTGAVRNPGTYEMLGRKTLLELISMAGGLSGDVADEIVIFRRGADGTTARIPLDLEGLVYRAEPALNVAIDPEDIIYIPTIEKLRIFVSGAVKNPDLYEIPRSQPITVLRAITLAGGTTDRAALKKVQVLRTDPDNGERVTLVVDLKKIRRGRAEDPILREDDVVLVPETFF